MNRVSTEQALKELENLANRNECDGTCDEYPPFTMCPECEAKWTLNHVGELLVDQYYKIFTE